MAVVALFVAPLRSYPDLNQSRKKKKTISKQKRLFGRLGFGMNFSAAMLHFVFCLLLLNVTFSSSFIHQQLGGAVSIIFSAWVVVVVGVHADSTF